MRNALPGTAFLFQSSWKKPYGDRSVCKILTRYTRYYSSGLLHGGPFLPRWSCDAGGLELGVVVVPSGAGLVVSPPS
jgi:hypothetical protein